MNADINMLILIEKTGTKKIDHCSAYDLSDTRRNTKQTVLYVISSWLRFWQKCLSVYAVSHFKSPFIANFVRNSYQILTTSAQQFVVDYSFTTQYFVHLILLVNIVSQQRSILLEMNFKEHILNMSSLIGDSFGVQCNSNSYLELRRSNLLMYGNIFTRDQSQCRGENICILVSVSHKN